MVPTTIDLSAIKQRTWTSELEYTPTSIVSYNISIGVDGSELPRSWEAHPDFHVLPTFASLAVVNVMGKVTRSMPEFLPNFRSYNHVHGEHYLEQYLPFPVAFPGTILRSTAQVVDVLDQGKGVTVRVGIITSDKKTGEKICYNEWTSFVRQVPGKGAGKPPTSQQVTIPPRSPDVVDFHKTTHTQSALYRATTTEWNPMHISPAHAKKGGFHAPILSGTCTIGMGVKHIIDNFAEGDVSRFKSVRLRLSAPVIIGDKVQTQMWVYENKGQANPDASSSNGVTRIVYRQVVVADELAGSKDRVVISNAIVELWNKSRLKSKI